MTFMDVYRERGLKRTVRIYADAYWNFIVNRYHFLCYIFHKREELYDEFERQKKHNNTVHEAVTFISRTDKWLRRRENISLKDYDEQLSTDVPYIGTVDCAKAQKNPKQQTDKEFYEKFGLEVK